MPKVYGYIPHYARELILQRMYHDSALATLLSYFVGTNHPYGECTLEMQESGDRVHFRCLNEAAGLCRGHSNKYLWRDTLDFMAQQAGIKYAIITLTQTEAMARVEHAKKLKENGAFKVPFNPDDEADYLVEFICSESFGAV